MAKYRLYRSWEESRLFLAVDSLENPNLLFSAGFDVLKTNINISSKLWKWE
jgi:hypothetical protein